MRRLPSAPPQGLGEEGLRRGKGSSRNLGERRAEFRARASPGRGGAWAGERRPARPREPVRWVDWPHLRDALRAPGVLPDEALGR